MTRFEQITQSPESLSDFLVEITNKGDPAILFCTGKCPFGDVDYDNFVCTDERLAFCWKRYLTEE